LYVTGGVVLGSAVGVGSVVGVLGDGSVVVGVLADGSGVLGPVGLGDGWELDGSPDEDWVGNDGADQGGVGAVGVADGNQPVPGLDALGFSRVGSSVGFRVGAAVTSSGEAPRGLPTGSLVVVPPDEVVLWDVAGVDGMVVADSRAPNGTNRRRPASVSTVATRALSFRIRGPPYRPIGPRTGLPFSSIQNAHPAGGLGQERSGVKFFGGRHRTFGGSGQPGGGLNCLKAKPFTPRSPGSLPT